MAEKISVLPPKIKPKAPVIWEEVLSSASRLTMDSGNIRSNSIAMEARKLRAREIVRIANGKINPMAMTDIRLDCRCGDFFFLFLEILTANRPSHALSVNRRRFPHNERRVIVNVDKSGS
jgi:hypothetical protein